MPIGKTVVLLPTVNEAKNLHEVLDRIYAALPQTSVLIIDDGSTDGTREIIFDYQKKTPTLHCLLRDKKLGLGNAYMAGFKWSLERGFDIIVQMDADLSHQPEQLPLMIRTLSGPLALVIGSRYVRMGKLIGWSLKRRLISRFGNLYARILLGLSFKDATGGFNVWTKEALERVIYPEVRSRGYCFLIELKYRAFLQGIVIKESPISFEERHAGHSKMSSGIVFEAILKIPLLRMIKRKIRNSAEVLSDTSQARIT